MSGFGTQNLNKVLDYGDAFSVIQNAFFILKIIIKNLNSLVFPTIFNVVTRTECV
jgi:hypothetical protein